MALPAGSGRPIDKLTVREHEIVHMVSAGMSNREIAKQLNISEETVKRHNSNVFDKLGCSNRVEMVQMYAGRPIGRMLQGFVCGLCEREVLIRGDNTAPVDLVLVTNEEGGENQALSSLCRTCANRVRSAFTQAVGQCKAAA